MTTLAIILPTLNERANLAPLIARIEASLGDIAWEAIVVDDDSTDGTAEFARDLAHADPRIRVMQRFGRRGLASAAIEGICATSAPFVAVMDADHQHDPALLPAMLEPVRAGEADIVVGSRFLEGGSTEGLADDRRERGSRIANALARRLTGVALTDPMSGFFLTRAETVRALAPRLSGVGFKLLLDILATADRPLAVRELPLRLAPRRTGESKLDRAVALDFLVGLYDRAFGRLLPTRFALFGTVGALGVGVHLAAVALLHLAAGQPFALATIIATLVAMTFNFWLNNWLTYRDRRLTGARAWATGWAGFVAACSIGALANVAVATLLEARGLWWLGASLAGIIVGAVWNFALSSRFVWGRY